MILKNNNSGRTITTLTTSPPFPRFLGWKWKQRRADSGLFWIQPLTPPPTRSFSNTFSLWRITNPLALQAAHTDSSCEHCLQLPSVAIVLAVFFCVHVPEIIRKLNNKKTPSWNKISIKFYFQIWAVKNVITNTMVTPCQNKRAT